MRIGCLDRGWEMVVKFLISIGSYERIVYGLDVEVELDTPQEPPEAPSDRKKRGDSKDKTDKQALKSSLNLERGWRCAKLQNSFAIPAHTGYIKCIASCSKFLATGGSDEVIRIFDLKRRRDAGSINEHNGSITGLEFWGTSHLISGSQDGLVGLFRTKDWENLQLFKHAAKTQSSTGVSGLAIHPSGKVCFSASEDGLLKLWNLVVGKQAASEKVPRSLLLQTPSSGPANLGPTRDIKVKWSTSGQLYALKGPKTVLLYQALNSRTQVSSPIAIYCSPRHLNAILFYKDEYMICVGEGSQIELVNLLQISLTSSTCPSLDEAQPDTSAKDNRPATNSLCAKLVNLPDHLKPRIKDISIVYMSDRGSDLLVAASSDGTIGIWNLVSLLKASDGSSVEPLAKHQSNLRITCLTTTRID